MSYITKPYIAGFSTLTGTQNLSSSIRRGGGNTGTPAFHFEGDDGPSMGEPGRGGPFREYPLSGATGLAVLYIPAGGIPISRKTEYGSSNLACAAINTYLASSK